MKILKYGGKYPQFAIILHNAGLIDGWGRQTDPKLIIGEGVNIVYYFKNTGYEALREYKDVILSLACAEMRRYESAYRAVYGNQLFFFTRLDVKYRLNTLGRKTKKDSMWPLGAKQFNDPEEVVYAEDIPEIKHKSLAVLIDSILDTVDEYLETYTTGKEHLKVTKLLIAVRVREGKYI